MGNRSFEIMEKMKKATGIKPKELVVFKPRRMVLHEIIIYIITHLKNQTEKDMRECYKHFLSKNEDVVLLLEQEFSEREIEFSEYISYIVQDYFHSVNSDEDLQKRFQKFSNDIQKRIYKEIFFI